MYRYISAAETVRNGRGKGLKQARGVSAVESEQGMLRGSYIYQKMQKNRGNSMVIFLRHESEKETV